MTMTVSLSKSKNQRKEVGRYAASSFSYSPLSLRSSGIDFMLIFRLENAVIPEPNKIGSSTPYDPVTFCYTSLTL